MCKYNKNVEGVICFFIVSGTLEILSSLGEKKKKKTFISLLPSPILWLLHDKFYVFKGMLTFFTSHDFMLRTTVILLCQNSGVPEKEK